MARNKVKRRNVSYKLQMSVLNIEQTKTFMYHAIISSEILLEFHRGACRIIEVSFFCFFFIFMDQTDGLSLIFTVRRYLFSADHHLPCYDDDCLLRYWNCICGGKYYQHYKHIFVTMIEALLFDSRFGNMKA